MFIMAFFKYQLTDEKSTVPWCVFAHLCQVATPVVHRAFPHGVFLHICNKKDGDAAALWDLNQQ